MVSIFFIMRSCALACGETVLFCTLFMVSRWHSALKGACAWSFVFDLEQVTLLGVFLTYQTLHCSNNPFVPFPADSSDNLDLEDDIILSLNE